MTAPLGLKLLLLSFVAATPASAATPAWPCPDFGQCRAQLVLGPCRMIFYFEYSRRLQVKGNTPFWEIDDPKPCGASIRVGKKLERFTFEQNRCGEVLADIERLATGGFGGVAEPSEVFVCDGASHAGRLTLVHPEQNFKEGAWRPLTREAQVIQGLESCSRVDAGQRVLVCPGLEGKTREWLVDFLARFRWSVRGRELLELEPAEPLRLAPGDRMRGGS